MFHIGYRTHTLWIDRLRLEYWRLVLRLTRWARQLQVWIVPIQRYLFIPVLAGLVGMLIGLLLTLP